MKVGLDTSVVLRLLTGEPEDQAQRALTEVQALTAHGVSFFVSDLVTSEVYFAMQYHYAVPKNEALKLLAQFFAESGVHALGAAASVLVARDPDSANPGFVDRLIHAEYIRSACEMLTFERAAGRLQSVRVLTVR